MLEVVVRQSQMITFDGRCSYGAAYHFGNPLNLEKVLEWELERLSKGLPTNVNITGVPFKAFRKAYTALKKERGIITIRSKCQRCNKSPRISLAEDYKTPTPGIIYKEENVYHHWSGVKMYTLPGKVFKVPERCPDCEGFGFREWIKKEEKK